MNFEDDLTNRIAADLEKRRIVFATKKMFGGVCFLVDDKMCVGTTKGRLMVRFDPADNEKVMGTEGVLPMDFTNKVMKGFAFVQLHAIETDAELGKWIELALEYNPRAKSSKKKKK
jgi:TfoX/Sxy family transcriptional regulator of competence genes